MRRPRVNIALHTQTFKLKLNSAGSALPEKSRKPAVTLDLASTSSAKPVATNKLALSFVGSGPVRHKPR